MNKQRTVILSLNKLSITHWLDEGITTAEVAKELGISLRHYQSALAGGVISYQLALKIANLIGQDVVKIISFDSTRRMEYAGDFSDLLWSKKTYDNEEKPKKKFAFIAEKIHEQKVIPELSGITKNAHIDILEDPLPEKALLEKFEAIISNLETTSYHLRSNVVKPRTFSESLKVKEGYQDLESLISEMYWSCYAFYYCRLPIQFGPDYDEDEGGHLHRLDTDLVSYQDCIFIAKDDLNFVYLSAVTEDPSDWEPKGSFGRFNKIEKPYLESMFHPTTYYQFDNGDIQF